MRRPIISHPNNIWYGITLTFVKIVTYYKQEQSIIQVLWQRELFFKQKPTSSGSSSADGAEVSAVWSSECEYASPKSARKSFMSSVNNG